MIKRVMSFLEGVPMTVVAGFFLVASLALMLAGIHLPVDPAWVTVAISGLPLLYLAVARLVFRRWISSALLISIAMVAAIAIGELFAAGEVAFIMAIGAILEDKTVDRAKKGLKTLVGLAPVQGRRIVAHDGAAIEELVPAGQIRVGDTLRVLPGEAIPVDGVILSGNTSVDQSIMTGESLPVDKAPGDGVFCGTINRFGAVDLRATRVGQDASLQKMIRMVQQAEDNKAPMQRTVDKWATWLVPIALAIAVATFAATRDIIRAVTILVVFCPCALALATPTSIMAAIGQATKRGVIIKSGDALERMGRVDTIAFDKTGTLTHGTLHVSDVVSFAPALSRRGLLEVAAAAEALSEHPLGKAVVAHARARQLVLRPVEDFAMVPGKGISAVLDARPVLCGSAAFLAAAGVTVDTEAQAVVAALQAEGKAAILVALDGLCVGALALSDTVRDTAADMVRELDAMGARVVLLTGDHRSTAEHLAGQVGITDVRAGLLPEEKVACIHALQAEGKNVCMIGDGVNDAPALKTADVGVAMGTMGSDIAVEAADIALMGDNIANIPYLKRLSRTTLSTIRLNITLSMALNLVAIVLSILAVLNPITGALVHNAGSVLVVLNAALLYDRKLDKRRAGRPSGAMVDEPARGRAA